MEIQASAAGVAGQVFSERYLIIIKVLELAGLFLTTVLGLATLVTQYLNSKRMQNVSNVVNSNAEVQSVIHEKVALLEQTVAGGNREAEGAAYRQGKAAGEAVVSQDIHTD